MPGHVSARSSASDDVVQAFVAYQAADGDQRGIGAEVGGKEGKEGKEGRGGRGEQGG